MYRPCSLYTACESHGSSPGQRQSQIIHIIITMKTMATIAATARGQTDLTSGRIAHAVFRPWKYPAFLIIVHKMHTVPFHLQSP